MNDKQIKEAIVERVKWSMDKLNAKFGTNYPVPPITFKLRGRAAGTFEWRRARHGMQLHEVNHSVNFHLVFAAENFDDYIINTVPHEVAHYFVFARYEMPYITKGDRVGLRKVKAHGYEWKSAMWAMGLDATRCHEYDTATQSAMTGRPKEYVYACSCSETRVTKVKHTNLQNNPFRYMYCRKCKRAGRPHKYVFARHEKIAVPKSLEQLAARAANKPKAAPQPKAPAAPKPRKVAAKAKGGVSAAEQVRQYLKANFATRAAAERDMDKLIATVMKFGIATRGAAKSCLKANIPKVLQ